MNPGSEAENCHSRGNQPTIMKILFSLSFLCFAVSSFCQTKMNAGVSKDHYLLKSRKQKTTAWVLLAGGAALITTGLLIPEGEVTGFTVYPDFADKHKNDNLKAAL